MQYRAEAGLLPVEKLAIKQKSVDLNDFRLNFGGVGSYFVILLETESFCKPLRINLSQDSLWMLDSSFDPLILGRNKDFTIRNEERNKCFTRRSPIDIGTKTRARLRRRVTQF